ncbi:hypothetical protein tloyanaT_33290 [Thalassotalea loyana]|uniref:RanBP2-type domain-containing protein n=1 Tax=Thalassotalea loyana TaxID=280483 RepID=A0ABQ6HJ47_9GAMM|nr:DUF2007 domain-containing protein [Thalassotalea loyana]GLX87076.1 hypothetical protein tloyanaT_33290 [Thalassotalea loyana]
MKKIYSNENNFLVHNVKNMVEAQGIEVFIKNEFAQGAVGDISAFDAWPELWVVDDADFERATNIIEASQKNTYSSDWICNNCQEVNDASFDICWQCQEENN